jgi:hypothetical protein
LFHAMNACIAVYSPGAIATETVPTRVTLWAPGSGAGYNFARPCLIRRQLDSPQRHKPLIFTSTLEFHIS